MTSVTERAARPAPDRSSRPEDDGALVELDRLTTKPPPAEAAHYASTVVAEVDEAFLDSLRHRPPAPAEAAPTATAVGSPAIEDVEPEDGAGSGEHRDPLDRPSVARELEALPLLTTDAAAAVPDTLPGRPVLGKALLSTALVFLMAAALLAIVVWTLVDQFS